MKKRFLWQLLAGGFIAIPLILTAHTVHAAVTYNSSSNTNVNGTLKSFGQKVEINGTVNGDVMCAGQDVTINATVTGDILCAGQHLTINGKVNGNIRLAGQSVTIGAAIARAATIAGQHVTFESDSSVGTDVLALAKTTTLDGTVKRDVHINGSNLNINGSVGRDVQFDGNKLAIADGAVVAGNLDYKSPQTAYIANPGSVHGEVSYIQIKESDKTGWLDMFRSVGFWIIFALVILLAAILFGLLLVWLFPRPITETAALGKKHFGKSLLTGLLAFIIWPCVLGIAAMTVIGLPIAAFIWAFGALIVMFGWATTGYLVGSGILRNSGLGARMSLGMFLLTLVVIIPVVGWILGIIAACFGTGMALLYLWERRASFKQVNTHPSTARIQ